MSTTTAKTAICYGRFSTLEQSKGYSLERQKTKAIEFATQQGWTVEKTIFDEGKSAYHAKNRAEGSALYEFELEARNGLHRGKVLVCENIDRLSRQGAKAAAQLIWALNEVGVDVATFHDGYSYKAGNNGDMMELFSVIIKAQLAFEESDKKSRRVKASWDKRREEIASGAQGVPVPNTPHWLKRVDGRYVLDEYRTKVLNEIFDLYINGMGISSIAHMLNERGEPVWTTYKNRNQNGWFYGYIWRLLTKRAALGEYVTNEGQTISTDFYPQAVSTDKWNQAQATLAMRKANQPARTRNKNHNLLAQIVFCDECGGGANFEHTHPAYQTYKKVSGEVVTYRRKTYRRLRCDRSRRKHQCDNPTILNYDVVEKVVLDELLPRLVDRQNEDVEAIKLREKIAEVGRQRDANQTRLNNLIDAIADGGSKALVQRVAELEGVVEQQNAEIDALEKQLAVETSKPSSDDDLALVESLRAELTSEDDDIRIYTRGRVNMALRRMLKRIVLRSTNTFEIWTDEHTWWLFDEDGVMLEGESQLQTGLSAEGLALLKQGVSG
ncbi:recombinase family protein [Novosphingobium sp. PY1]|uniref:recombinase family protein n=1 Tax=Novosphingobium sp. PY1 TaxID=1882221 RepID=UPI001A8FE064|nr:recombinase family protein [Novosphingobium sp. PY1]GFM27196.1 uncharacterized protein PY1_contig-01-57 [Novosphingobium sp. PY1]